jgi:DNA-binding transcriptional ArsR family regulator
VAVTLLLDSPDARLFTVRRSPLAELCACLHALDEPAHHPLSAGWVSAVHATLDASLLARAAAWAPLWGAFRARYLLPLSAGPRPAPRARLEQTSPVLGRSAEFGGASAGLGRSAEFGGASGGKGRSAEFGGASAGLGRSAEFGGASAGLWRSADLGWTLAAELADVAALPLPDFTAMTLQALIGQNDIGPAAEPPPAPTRRGGGPDETPAVRERSRVLPWPSDEVLHRLRLISSSRHELGARLRADPAGFRGDLLTFLADFAATAFEPEWPALRASLDREAALRERNLRRHGPLALADLPTASIAHDPPRVSFDKIYGAVARVRAGRPCVLVPTRHGSPHLVLKHYPGYPVVVQYGMGGHTAPTLETTRRRLAVLQDPGRLRLCHAILRQPAATAELATQLGMTAPQVSRHLRRLREAGLVHTHRRGAVVYYQLDAQAVEGLGRELLAVLHR